MMAPGHMTHGALFGLATAPLVPHPIGLLPSSAAYVAICVVGALVPDLDHPKSRLTHALGPITWVLNKILVRLSKATYALTRGPKDYPHTNGHRCLTHTPLFALLAGVLVWWGISATPAPSIALLAGLGITVGCLAHLCGDSLTNSGVPWLWPLRLNGRRWGHYGIPKVLRFETGGGQNKHALTWAAKGEHITTLASVSLAVAVPVGYLYLGWGV